ncbi:sigma-70 family RNA polymerase sigma factor [uncultured Sunxiuqinia sp.]|uniref:sigma-70 family RNA polymerase sigma factor n=1 Tax=uncultured Sunxiuqinia sp. TaxID=1573825 RepID=UPI002AA8A709|nr:sigma-70 family RNA polymerase sigma factor [uncultured Sunxiuqinia sp.]
MKRNNSDIVIFERIKSGNSDALTALFNKYYQQICRFTFLFIPENKIVEELTANVFINLWETRKKITIHSSVKAYLYQAAKNQAISFLRKNKNMLTPLDDFLDLPDRRDQTPEAIYIEGELNLEFTKAYKKLPNRAQLAFKLHRLDGLKYSEVAEIMNISIGAVEKNITSALKILHSELHSYTKAN